MLILNKEKENLLVEKYGFEECEGYNNMKYYKYGGTLTINGSNYNENSLKVRLYSYSQKTIDKLYELIKDDVILYMENTKNISEMVKLKNNIKELEDRIKELEENNEKR